MSDPNREGRKFHPELLEEPGLAEALDDTLATAQDHPELDVVDLMMLDSIDMDEED